MKLLIPLNFFARGVLFGAICLFLCNVLLAQDFPLIDDDAELVTAANPAASTFLNDGSVPTTIEQLRSMENIFAEVIELVAPATVNIMVGDAQGSGVVVSRDGYVLTAAHVIGRPNLKATITFPDGSTAKAITLGVNRKFDSGMLRIKDEGKWPFVDIGESEPLKQGQWVMSIGHPGGLTEGRGLVYRAGRILRKPRITAGIPNWIGSNESTIVTDCTLVGGDSGGPLVDLDGYVIGIHSRIGGKLSENFHVPIDVYSMDWDELADGVIVGSTKPLLGINSSDQDGQLKVIRIFENEGAAKAGMKKDDIILKINDIEIKTKKNLTNALKKFKPKDKIKVVVKRDDEEIELEITLGYQ